MRLHFAGDRRIEVQRSSASSRSSVAISPAESRSSGNSRHLSFLSRLVAARL
ncbi:MAG: hypothetical protein WBD58_21805 [Geitlerinemataceae cyanobacterium]